MNQDNTYNPSFFEELKLAEKGHFWFHVRRKWIFDKIRQFVPPPACVLEVGCGTGNVSSFLAQKGYIVTGCEFYREALNMSWPGFQIVQGNANNLPFADNSFDIVGLFDVIEHFDEDILPLKEATRILRKGGVMVLTVPARDELWSWVDEASFHKRRYTKETLHTIFSNIKLHELLTEYMFMSLYLPMKFMRGKKRKFSNHFKINNFVNLILKGIFNFERISSKVVSLPIGTSLLAVAQKDS